MKKVYFGIVFIIAVLLSCQSVFAQTSSTWIKKGDMFEEKGIHSEAVKAYTKAIEEDSRSSEAYLKRGTTLFSDKKSNCTKALADLTKAIELTPDYVEAYYQRGIVNFYMINNEQGRSDMKTAAALGHTGAQEWLGMNKEEEQFVLVEETSPEKKPAVYFDHDKSNIKPAYHELLEEVGTIITGDSSLVSIILSGHADSTGTNRYNDTLSLERANNVKEYLVKHFNVKPGKIAVTAYGEEMPATSNSTPEGRALNRRVEISGLGTQDSIPGN